MTTESIAVRDGGAVQQELAAIMLDAKAIGKASRNQSQGFNFRGIDAVMNHLHPIFAKHGVIILPEVLAERTEERQTKHGGNLIYRVLTVRFRFTAADGSSVCSTVIGEGMDSGDKAANKAMAVALKYALTQMLLLPYDEIDPDATMPPPSTRKPLPADVATPVKPLKHQPDDSPKISEPQRKRLFAIADKAGVTADTLHTHLLNKYGIEHSKDIERRSYESICAWAFSGGQTPPADKPDTDAGRKDGNPY